MVQPSTVAGAPYRVCQTEISWPTMLEALAAMSTAKAVASS